jgi:roadblock/LC7 domain-containing protein
MGDQMSEVTPPVPPPAAPPPEPPQPSRPAGGGGSSGPDAYPVNLTFDGGLEVSRWRPLVNWLLAFPHWIVLYFLNIAANVLGFLSLFVILFTRRNPFVGFQTMVLRYQWRVTSFVFFMREEYPPFEFDTVARDPATDAARVDVEEPQELNRWLPLVKWFLAIPHLIVLVVLAIAVFFVWIIGFFAVLFTGKWPEGLRDFVVGFMRWGTRVNAYGFRLLRDEYPPFSLE